MQVSFHIGAHCTDEDQLVKTLLKNVGMLSQHGVVVPGPSRYRNLIAEIVARLNGGKANRETQDVLLEAVMDIDRAERVVFSQDNFLGARHRAFEHGELYRLVADKATRLRNLFPDSEVGFFIGIRDIATFIPAMFEKSDEKDFRAFMEGVNPFDLYWSDVIHSLREALPDSPVTVWCNEDTPMLWTEILHEITGLEPGIAFKGGFDILARIMAKEGMQRLRKYLLGHPPQNEIQRRRILSAFLDKYALPEAVEEEIDLPGWTPELVDDLSQAYDDDMLEIAHIPGVTLLTP